MKRGMLFTVLGTAFMSCIGLISLIFGLHHRSVATQTDKRDPCQSPPSVQRPDNCDSHGSSGSHIFYSRRSSDDTDDSHSGHGEGEAESAGHAGFGESAGGHSGGGGE